MSWAGQATVNRARTGEGVPYFQDPQEELSHVASLVGKRRMQNRVSQRNYRNRIRDRLEALEALVGERGKGEAAAAITSTSKLPTTSGDSRADGAAASHHVHTPNASPQGRAPLSSPPPSAVLSPEHLTSHDDFMQDFIDARGPEIDGIFDFTAEPGTSSEQYHPVLMSPGGFGNHGESMSMNLSLPTSTNAISSSKKSESVNTEELPCSRSPADSIDATTVAPTIMSGRSSPQPQQRQQNCTYNSYNFPCPCHMPMPGSSMNLPPYPPGSNPGKPSQDNSPSPRGTMNPSTSSSFTSPMQYVWVLMPVMTAPVQTQPQ